MPELPDHQDYVAPQPLFTDLRVADAELHVILGRLQRVRHLQFLLDRGKRPKASSQYGGSYLA